ncbi:MAG: hypothetical protein FWF46_04150 [Oscillospiraceae bacterium]|nr:hypothetical protein [Oscillospiraceae bacterium]
MQREITVREIESTLNKYDNIDEPIIVKRDNKSRVVIIDMEEYFEKLNELEIIKHLQKSEEDIEKGRTIPADKYFMELRVRYGN